MTTYGEESNLARMAEARFCAEAERRMTPSLFDGLSFVTERDELSGSGLQFCDPKCPGRVDGGYLVTIMGRGVFKLSDRCPMLERFAEVDRNTDLY